MARGRCLDEKGEQEWCGTMLSGSGELVSIWSKNVKQEGKSSGPTKVRVRNGLMQVRSTSPGYPK